MYLFSPAAGESLPAVMLAPATGDRKRDHLSAHHHHMVRGVYSFDSSTGLPGAKISAPSLASGAKQQQQQQPATAAFFSTSGVTSSPPPTTTATSAAAVGVATPSQNSVSQSLPSNKKSRLDPVPNQVHSSPATPPPASSSSGTSPANNSQIPSPAPLRCTICNG